MGVTEGASGPVLTHCDHGTQIEEKKQKEHERRRNGEAPVAATVNNR